MPLTESADESAEHGNATASRRGGDFGRDRWIDLTECSKHVAFERSHRNAVAVKDAITGSGAETLGAGDDTGEIQWGGRPDGHQRPVRTRPTKLTHAIDGVRQRELLSRHSGHKSPTADL